MPFPHLFATLESVPCAHEAVTHVVEGSCVYFDALAHRSPRRARTSARKSEIKRSAAARERSLPDRPVSAKRLRDAARCLFQQRMSVRQLMRIPGREPMPNRLLADLVFRHRRDDLVVHEQAIDV